MADDGIGSCFEMSRRGSSQNRSFSPRWPTVCLIRQKKEEQRCNCLPLYSMVRYLFLVASTDRREDNVGALLSSSFGTSASRMGCDDWNVYLVPAWCTRNGGDL